MDATCPSCETICLMLCAPIACHWTCHGGGWRRSFPTMCNTVRAVVPFLRFWRLTTYLLIQNCRLIADRYLQYPHHLWCWLWRGLDVPVSTAARWIAPVAPIGPQRHAICVQFRPILYIHSSAAGELRWLNAKWIFLDQHLRTAFTRCTTFFRIFLRWTAENISVGTDQLSATTKVSCRSVESIAS